MTPASRGGYEQSDAPPKAAAAAIGAMLLLTAITAGAVALLLQTLSPDRQPVWREGGRATGFGPRLHSDARLDRLALERRQAARLQVYGWSDQAAGLARIPIADAMALQARGGWPDPEEGR